MRWRWSAARIGERYILGGENLLLRDLLAMIARMAGRSPPLLALPIGPLMPVAAVMEALAKLTGREPLMTRDHLKMARHRMFFSSAKAFTELGLSATPGGVGGARRGGVVPGAQDVAHVTTPAAGVFAAGRQAA